MSEEGIYNQLSLEDQINLCSQALYFFSPMSYEKVVGFTNRKPTPGSMQPFTVLDFFQYLKNTEVLQNPNKYGLCISNILRKLASANLLKLIDIISPVFGEAYYYLRFRDTEFDKGKYWQAACFGSRIYLSSFHSIYCPYYGDGS